MNAPRSCRGRLLTAVGMVAACLLPIGPGAGGSARHAVTVAQVRTGGGPAVSGDLARREPAGPAAADGVADGAPAPRAAPTEAPGPPVTTAPGDGPARATGPPPPGAGTPAPGVGYAWPLLPPPAVLTSFRAPTHAYGPGHRGVDLAGRSGQPVLAARAGTVVFAGPVAGHGVVSVQHDDGLRTTYEPVFPTVAAGAVVRAGDVLGLLDTGHAGCPGAVCLHWGVRRDRLDYLDPLVLLGPTRVRLLPVPDPWPDGDPPAPPPLPA